jgi:hypothetical protein|tara:strand:- start:422 stop:553 length:132 start_codon:yes stop_codon:yes gene_type:complete
MFLIIYSLERKTIYELQVQNEAVQASIDGFEKKLGQEKLRVIL